MSGPPPIRRCHFCGDPLPRNANPLQRYCSHACRQANYRTKQNPGIPAKAKIPPSPAIPDDPTKLTIGEILRLKLEPTLRKAVLDLKAKVEQQERELQLLKSEDEWKEERTIDAKLAKEIADFLAEKYNPSRTR